MAQGLLLSVFRSRGRLQGGVFEVTSKNGGPRLKLEVRSWLCDPVLDSKTERMSKVVEAQPGAVGVFLFFFAAFLFRGLARAMADDEWSAMYVSQLYRSKKIKSWQEGVVKFDRSTSKATLYDSKRSKLDSAFLVSADLVADFEIEFDRFYCILEQRKAHLQERATPNCATNSGTNREVGAFPLQVGPAVRKPAARRIGLSKKSVSVVSSSLLLAKPAITEDADDDLGGPSDFPSHISDALDTRSALRSEYFEANRIQSAQEIDSSLRLVSTAYEPSTEPLGRRAQRTSIARTTPSCISERGSYLEASARHSQIFHSQAITRSPPVLAQRTNLNGSVSRTDTAPTFPGAGGQVPSELPTSSAPRRALQEPSYNAQPDTQATPPRQTAQPSQRRFHPPASTGLRFPTSAEGLRQSPGKLTRSLPIPCAFKNASAYKEVFLKALNEHLQIQIQSIAYHFYSINSSRFASPYDFDKACRSKGVLFISKAALSRFRAANEAAAQFSSSLKERTQKHYILAVKSRVNQSDFSRDDIWVISSNDTFAQSFLARSVFYGVSSSSTVELVPLSDRDGQAAERIINANPALSSPTARQSGTISVVAIRLLNAMTELLLISNLNSQVLECPLLPAIMSSSASLASSIGVCTSKYEDICALAEDTACEYTLNPDQKAVLESFVLSLLGKRHPITLCFGVFGSGKSFLVCVIIILLHRMWKLELLPQDFKVVISSMTNVAVDRILLGLAKLGFNEFVRVGSLKKIAKPLLPFTAQGQKGESDDAKELHSILEDPELLPSERRAVQEAIRRFNANENKTLTANAFAIGVTCIATSFDCLSNVEASVLILDECSQMTEPLSLLPLAKFHSTHALLIGDPRQLPPTLTTSCKKTSMSLDRTLFERLAEQGNEPVMLSIQYRCHPQIANASNALFYENSLSTGESIEVSPVLKDTPALVFLDAREGQEEGSGSLRNTAEISLVLRIIRPLMRAGVPNNEIGIITFYRSQADAFRSQLRGSSEFNGLQVSTVDAFQGAEKAVILISTVRTKNTQFIDDPRRVNVALTRAKRHLFIVGNRKALELSQIWKEILHDHSVMADTHRILDHLSSSPVDPEVIDKLKGVSQDEPAKGDEEYQGDLGRGGEDPRPLKRQLDEDDEDGEDELKHSLVRRRMNDPPSSPLFDGDDDDDGIPVAAVDAVERSADSRSTKPVSPDIVGDQIPLAPLMSPVTGEIGDCETQPALPSQGLQPLLQPYQDDPWDAFEAALLSQ